MREIIHLSTARREELVDITAQVADVVRRSAVRNGLVTVYAQGATAAIMIQENWDESVQTDVVTLLRKLIPRGFGCTIDRTATATTTCSILMGQQRNP